MKSRASESATLSECWNTFQHVRIHAAARGVYAWSIDMDAYSAYVEGRRDDIRRLTADLVSRAKLPETLRKLSKIEAVKADAIIGDGIVNRRG